MLKFEICKDRLYKNVTKTEEFYFESENNRESFFKELKIFLFKNKIALNYELINNSN